MRYALAIVILAANFGSALAAEPYEGSWAGQAINCEAPNDSNIRITGKHYYAHEADCQIKEVQKTAVAYALYATCTGEGDKWDDVFVLVPKGDTMRLGGTNGTPLVRCRKKDRAPNWPQ